MDRFWYYSQSFCGYQIGSLFLKTEYSSSISFQILSLIFFLSAWSYSSIPLLFFLSSLIAMFSLYQDQMIAKLSNSPYLASRFSFLFMMLSMSDRDALIMEMVSSANSRLISVFFVYGKSMYFSQQLFSQVVKVELLYCNWAESRILDLGSLTISLRVSFSDFTILYKILSSLSNINSSMDSFFPRISFSCSSTPFSLLSSSNIRFTNSPTSLFVQASLYILMIRMQCLTAIVLQSCFIVQKQGDLWSPKMWEKRLLLLEKQHQMWQRSVLIYQLEQGQWRMVVFQMVSQILLKSPVSSLDSQRQLSSQQALLRLESITMISMNCSLSFSSKGGGMALSIAGTLLLARNLRTI